MSPKVPAGPVLYAGATLVFEAGRARDSIGWSEWNLRFDRTDKSVDRQNPRCVVCGRECNSLFFKKFETAGYEREKDLVHCDECKWWSVDVNFYHGEGLHLHREMYWAILRQFSVSSNDIPIASLREYLEKHYDDVTNISAQKAEELVRSVFRDVYPASEVNYFRGGVHAPDGGVDLVLIENEVGMSAVQVKRRRRRSPSESVQPVREFVASLILNGFRSGIYVALSNRFSRLAKDVPSNTYLKQLGIELQLLDSDRFYGLLKSAAKPSSVASWASYVGDYDYCGDESRLAKLNSEYSNA